ncbi:Uncharacterized protein TPAR_06305, partial [Tolypocladium paradoxum]
MDQLNSRNLDTQSTPDNPSDTAPCARPNAAMQPLELTLIVAATRSMGIGARGAMPWNGLSREMQYFARVTTRLPPQSPPGAVNAVIMGRKTWDSIPPRFRPLKDRLNIVITRSAAAAAAPPASSPGAAGGPVR